jgi:membrane-associated PAP2 superfamily phosphatase
VSRWFWVVHGVLPALLFLPLALVFQYTPLDLHIADHFYDAARGAWIGSGTWWAKDLIHEAGRRLIALIGLTALALALAAHGLEHLRPWRQPALFVGLSILACTALVALLKHYSNVDCPQDLLRYGGDRDYVHVFADKPDDAPRGACFPGGHSSGAFSLLAFYFLLVERRRSLACLALVGALALGSVYAVGQWARGEHFLSHDAWSAMICWYVTLALYAAFRGRVSGR